METGYDIIFFWVARMMMLGLELTGTEPFHTVYLSGLIRDPEGKKMSKTKGTGVDPLDVIDESGADALRFAVIHGATPGNDQRFGPAKLEHARNFANKLWNATRFVVGARPATIAADAERRIPVDADLGPAERWLRLGMAATTEAVDAAMGAYTFGEVTRLLYDAIWSEYCDWGVELAKVRLSDESSPTEAREATWWTLVEVLDGYLRLLHPVMPFVTEALWASLPHRASDPELLIVARWPGVGARDEAAEGEVETIKALVTEIRNARAAAKLPAGDWLATRVYVPAGLGATFEALRPAIERLARARPLSRDLSPEQLQGQVEAGDLVVIVTGSETQAVDPAGRHGRRGVIARTAASRTRARGSRGLAGGGTRTIGERGVHISRPRRGGGGCACPRGRAR